MAEVVLKGVSKVYPGGFRAVNEIDLHINDREFIVLVGPSGCGKSTTLRMIAGLEDITGGTIAIGDRVVNDLAPKDRDIAMVFQNYALYPHMTVLRNLTFGLMLRRRYAAWDNVFGMLFAPGKFRHARAEREEINQRAEQAANMLGITHLLDRKPRALSGGQRQRVAVGRAIVREPKAFLFDEPLSNLDAKLRVETRAELKRLHRRVQTTTIYVTHDQEEAMTLGDRVVVMKDGVIHQLATPFEVYDRPVNRFVAGFVGTPPMNFLEGKLTRAGERLVFDDGQQKLAVAPEHHAALAGHANQTVILGVRPEMTHLADGSTPADEVLAVDVAVVEPLGERMDVHASTPQHAHIVCRVDARLSVKEAEPARLHIDMRRVHYFANEPDGANLTLNARN